MLIGFRIFFFKRKQKFLQCLKNLARVLPKDSIGPRELGWKLHCVKNEKYSSILLRVPNYYANRFFICKKKR